MAEPLTERVLPPIHRIREPKMQHASTRIRWYLALGYTPLEISKGLGIRYQQVRNVRDQQPKRATREDIPDTHYETWPIDDDVDAMGAQALMENMAAQKLGAIKDKAAQTRFLRKLAADGIIPEDGD